MFYVVSVLFILNYIVFQISGFDNDNMGLNLRFNINPQQEGVQEEVGPEEGGLEQGVPQEGVQQQGVQKNSVEEENEARRANYDSSMAGVADSLRIRMDPLNQQMLRIRGGNGTSTLNYPYIAAIIINGRLWCAGAIVDVNWVITAAHCLNYVLHVSPMKTLAKYVQVRVGTSRAHEGGTLFDVVGAVRHPKFEEEPVPHADVALLKLSGRIEFGSHVNLIKIYEGMKEPFAQSFIVISGWGATKGTDMAFREQTPELLTARLKVRTQHYCTDAYQLVNGFMFTDDFFCASLRNGTRDACLFDAGAPAVQQNKLMGIMSFGPERCGHEYQPAVFIKAFYFRDFVKHTISSYKSTNDLIEAMQSMDPTLQPPVVILSQQKDEHFHNIDEVTPPDMKHD